MMSRFRVTPRRRRHTTARRQFRLGPTIGRILAVGVIAVLAVVALSQATGRETAIYTATALREQEGGLNQEINELKLLEARAKTLDRISKSEVSKDMVPVSDDVEYLDKTPAVAGATTSR